MATAQQVMGRDQGEVAGDGEPFCVCLSRYTGSVITTHLALHGVNLLLFNFTRIYSH